MNRREPGYLIPEQRRCEHLWSISLRNLRCSGGAARGAPPGVYFVLCVGDTAIYRSELADATVNPTWMPMEWQYLRMDPPEEALLKAPALRLAVHTTESMRQPPPPMEAAAASTVGAGDTRTPWYFPPAGWAAPACDELVLDVALDLRDLQFLAFDVLDVLSEVRPGGAEGGGRVGGGKDSAGASAAAAKEDGGSVELPPDALGFQLDALPQNFLVLWLDDGHYTTLEAYGRLLKPGTGGQGSGVSAAAAGHALAKQEGAGSGGATQTAKLDLRRGFDAANRLIQLRRDTLAARATTSSALEQLRMGEEGQGVSQPAARPAPAAARDSTEAMVSHARRVIELRRLAAELSQEVQNAESALLATRTALLQRAAATGYAVEHMRSVEALLPIMDSELEDARGDVSLVRNLISAKQLSLLSELRALYPIVEVERGRKYSIRGIALPDRELTSLPEEQVSTALGYTCHLVQLMSKYLGVPLRYTPCHMASRSTMRDDAVMQSRDFPLYWKGASQEEFAVAVHLLQRDIRQVLFSQGVAVTESHLLASLSRLFSLLLDVPLPTESG